MSQGPLTIWTPAHWLDEQLLPTSLEVVAQIKTYKSRKMNMGIQKNTIIWQDVFFLTMFFAIDVLFSECNPPLCSVIGVRNSLSIGIALLCMGMCLFKVDFLIQILPMGSTTSPLKESPKIWSLWFSHENLRVYPPCKCHPPLVFRRFFFGMMLVHVSLIRPSF